MDLTDRLSKSRFVAGLQCPLRLYLSVHRRDLATPPPPALQARFAVGNRVGALAQARYPGGVLVAEDHFHQREAVATTRRLMAEGVRDIFEAAFTYDDIKVRVDVLHKLEDGGWELIEVKSTTRYDAAKHQPDVGVQTYVLRGAGVDVRRVTLMHLDTGYVYPGGEYDPHSILAATDVTADAFAYAETVAPLVAEMMRVLALPRPPEIACGRQCTTPYECEFAAWCTRDASDGDQSDVPVRVDSSALRRLERAPHPLFFADFETINPALPLFPGTSPYQVIPVQWSLHRLDADGTLTHNEGLFATPGEDPSEAFLTSLLDALGDTGTFVHYSSYELTRLVELGVRFPHLRERLLATLPGLYDRLGGKLLDRGERLDLPRPEGGLSLLDLGRDVVKPACDHPAFGGGKWSIKIAVRLLAPDLPAYSSLAVSDGAEAMLAIEELLAPETPAERAEAVREALLGYCRQDTLAMVEIYRTLAGHLAEEAL